MWWDEHRPRGEQPRRKSDVDERAHELHVLVVDDDFATREAMRNAITSFGYECRTARDGQEAWELLEIIHADIVVSDWRMPRMDGLELLRRIRENETDGPSAYFILTSDYGDKRHYVLGIEAGADDYHAKPFDPDELRARLSAAARVVRLQKKLEAKSVRLTRDSQRSFELARVDPLTEIANRLRMDEDLSVAWSLASRYSRRFSAALFDVDWFKAYNDDQGHLAGDQLLRRIAHALRDGLRQGDGLYRYGGEEFLILLPEQTIGEAMIACDRLRARVSDMHIPTPAGSGIVTVSAGAAELAGGTDTSVEAWLERVDKALYRAKAHGRDCVEGAPTPTVSTPAPGPSPA
jgi:two-component system chemotaxis response regulator CheY